MALPTTLAEIDGVWLGDVLGRTVRAADVVDVRHGATTLVRLALEADGLPPTVILKGGFEPHSPEMGFMHHQEVRFYRDLRPELGLRSPEPWFADFEDESGQGIIIMEDLVPRGVTFGNALAPQRPAQVARRLSALAAYHAQTWGSPELEPGGRYACHTNSVVTHRGYIGSFLHPDRWPGIVTLPRGAAVSVRFLDMEWVRDALDRMVAFAEDLPRCIVHGDTHLNNLYEEPDGTPGFFDSQPHQAPAMVDVTYHITCALDSADRRASERDLLQHYIDELARHGVDAPSLDDVVHQYAQFLLHGFLIFLVNRAVWQPEAVNTAHTARFNVAMLEHGWR